MIFIKFRLDLSRVLAVWVFTAVLFYRGGELALAYTAALCHEAAHLGAALCFGIIPTALNVGVFGVRLDIPYVSLSKSRAFIYLSGPLASFALFAVLYALYKIFNITAHLYLFFTYANLVIGVLNLMPMFPLDGAVVLRAVLSGCMGILRGARLCRIISIVFCTLASAVNALFFLEGIFNPSSAVILCFLARGICREREYSLIEKKQVLSGEISCSSKIRYIACDFKSDLLSLAGFISTDYTVYAAAFCDDRFFAELSQSEITDGIKKYGALCTIEELVKKRI